MTKYREIIRLTGLGFSQRDIMARDLITSIKSFRSTLLLTFMVVPLSLISIVLSREAAFGSSVKLFTTGHSSIISNLTTSCFSETGITLEGTGVKHSHLI